jgi:hypothetical protein
MIALLSNCCWCIRTGDLIAVRKKSPNKWCRNRQRTAGILACALRKNSDVITQEMLVGDNKVLSPWNGRQRKAWGEAQRNPRLMFRRSLQPAEWVTASAIQDCRPRFRGLRMICETKRADFSLKGFQIVAGSRSAAQTTGKEAPT